MVHVSPSQRETWRDCRRKWAYSRVRPRVQNRYAAFGDRTHKVLEDWLQFGKAPDLATPEGRCAAAGLHLLPMPGTAVVEHTWSMEYGGVTYTGRIDFCYGYDPERIVVIGDHKTTGNLAYAKTPEQLAADTQRIIYSRYAATELGVEYVAGHWVYYKRGGKPHAHPSIYVEHRDQIEQRFLEIHETDGVQIAAAALLMEQGKPPEEFPRSFSACNAYGGCPYTEECHRDVSPIDRASSILLQTQHLARKNQ